MFDPIPSEKSGTGSTNLTGRAFTTSFSPTLKLRKQAEWSQSPSLDYSEKKYSKKKGNKVPNVQRYFSEGNVIKSLDFVKLASERNSVTASRCTKRSALTSRETKTLWISQPTSIKVISLNDQAKVRQKGPTNSNLNQVLREKFNKKYNHFRRTQHNVYVKHLGKFNSLAEIKNRANSVIVQNDEEQTKAEIEQMIAQEFPHDKAKTEFIEKKAKELIRLRRKILDGEIIDFSKYYSGKSFRRDQNKEVSHEQFRSEGFNTDISRPQTITSGRNFWLPMGGVQNYSRDLVSEKQRESSNYNSNRSNKMNDTEQLPYVKSKTNMPKYLRGEKGKGFIKSSSKKSISLYEGIHQKKINNNSNKIIPYNSNNGSNSGNYPLIEINQLKARESKEVMSLEASMLARESQLYKYELEINGSEFYTKVIETNNSEGKQIIASEDRIIENGVASIQNFGTATKQNIGYLNLDRASRQSSSKRKRETTQQKSPKEEKQIRLTDTTLEGWDAGPDTKREIPLK